MMTVKNVAIIGVVVVAVAAVAYVRQSRSTQPSRSPVPVEDGPGASEGPRVSPESPLPKLVDLGAGKCIPCKMMAPILAALKKDYAGRMDVQFIDVWQDPVPGQKYGIRVIPTQIFLAPDGRELFRHEGFYSREDILAKWAELGIAFGKGR